jgi:hypothetical protein
MKRPGRSAIKAESVLCRYGCPQQRLFANRWDAGYSPHLQVIAVLRLGNALAALLAFLGVAPASHLAEAIAPADRYRPIFPHQPGR